MPGPTEYEVKAKLVLDARKGLSAAAKYQAQITKLARQLERADKQGAAHLARSTRQAGREAERAARAYQRMGDKAARAAAQASRMRDRQVGAFAGGGGGGLGLGGLIGFGAVAAGVHALISTFKQATTSAITYVGWLDKTKIGITSVIQAVENTAWEDAEKRATGAFKAIQDLAIKSPATSAEMFDIFSGIFGPIRAAGFEMEKVLDITNDTVSAASALNVDYQQASRDISMMARGTAGMEVKLFSMLRSTGAIKEDAQAWNAMLPAERVTKLAAALKKFSAAGEKYGKSWVGITSSFTDIVQTMGARAFKPITDVIGKRLDQFNQYVLANRDAIGAYLERVGERTANALDRTFKTARSGLVWVVNHWDEILSKTKAVVAQMREAAPALAKAAAAYALITTGSQVVSGGASAIAGVTSMAGIFGGASGGAGAATGGAGLGAGTVAGVAALGPVLAGVAAAAAAFAGVFLVVREQWDSMSKIFGPSFLQMGSMLAEFGGVLWKALGPPLKIVGNIIMGVLSPAWTILTGLFRGVIFVTGLLADTFGSITTAIYDKMKPAFDFLFELFAKFATFVDTVFSEARKGLGDKTNVQQNMKLKDPEWAPGPLQDAFDAQHLANVKRKNRPSAPVQVTNDFRGSRISIKQDFKGDTDPDRIVMATIDAMTRQAEQRVSSGFAGALTR